MKRLALVLCIVAAAMVPLAAAGQSAPKLPRLCFLTFDPPESRTGRFAAFFVPLQNLGYVDGRTIVIDWMSAEGDGSRFPALAAECLSRNTDIIVASTTPATQAAKAATQTVPIVMLSLADPVGTGLVASLARPGANVTGMSYLGPDLAAKRLELLSELVPGLSKVLVLSFLADPIAALQIKALEDAARQLKITLAVHEVRAAPPTFRRPMTGRLKPAPRPC
ncbi:MAG: hypothetical protein EXQ87_05340 [Alphaproteobacteria bacterium]|nr:hypothetical protein [Alphaproteobacteria bacterium]